MKFMVTYYPHPDNKPWISKLMIYRAMFLIKFVAYLLCEEAERKQCFREEKKVLFSNFKM